MKKLMKLTFLKCRNEPVNYKLQQNMRGETWFSNSWRIPAKRPVGWKWSSSISNAYPTTMDHPYTASKGFRSVSHVSPRWYPEWLQVLPLLQILEAHHEKHLASNDFYTT